MGERLRELPPLPEGPNLPWISHLKGSDREEYETTRKENIEELLPDVLEKLKLYFPNVVEADPEMAAALVLRWATGLRNYFEAGIQEGGDIASKNFQRERDHFHSIEIARLGGYG